MRLLGALLGRLRDPARPQIGPGTYVDRHSTVGAYTYIGRYGLVSRASVGRYCSIADHVSIGPGEHPVAAVSTSTLFVADPYALLTRLPCIVGHDVWIGVGATIRRGVTVGNGAGLRRRQVRAEAASPLLPCDRCGVLTPASALFAHQQDGYTIEVCGRCEWPCGI